jgi:hypothetical protein
LYLSKSDYTNFLQCPKLLWLSKFRKDLKPETTETQQAIFDQGHEVEAYADQMFPNGIKITQWFEKGRQETQAHVQSNNNPTIFQANAMPPDLYCKADILNFNEQTKLWDLYEVKSTTQVKPEHIPDVAFQKLAFERDGIKIGRTYLIHLNKNYVRKGDIDPQKLLTITDITEEVENLRQITETTIPKALATLKQTQEVQIQIGKQCNNPHPCPFIPYCWANVPEYSIYDLRRVTQKQLDALTAIKIEKITDVPDDFKLTEAQQNQVMATKTGKPIIDKASIKAELAKLTFPLYFLDYETFAPAIPLFDGLKPYQQMPFQYSLHVIKSEGEEPEHYEYLHTGKDNPIPALVEHMKKNIGPEGSVIVWNKSFEMGRNKEMAEMFPEYASFLESVNARVFDLMDIFKNQHYVDADFKGSCSIKKVLPVIVPSLSYADLEDVQEGGIASLYWFKHIYGDSAVRARVEANMLKYCELDTLAMVEVWRELKG